MPIPHLNNRLRSLAEWFLGTALALVLAYGAGAHAQNSSPTCTGKFPNFVTDFCWSCVFPLTIGGATIMSMNQEDNNSTSSGNPFCACQSPPRAGLRSSFFEPAYIVEQTRTPYCFVTLGGIRIDPGFDAPAHGRVVMEGGQQRTFYQSHWFKNPIMYMLEILLDNSCLEKANFDLVWFTEVDPTHADSALTFLLNPDVALFANPVAKAVCAADCVAATAGFPIDEAYWCSGCAGSVFPLNGFVDTHIGGVQASSLLTTRFMFKMHRQLLMPAASGDDGLCGHYFEPVLKKSNYKTQMIFPVANTAKVNGRCCHPIGRSTAVWGSGKELPGREDFSYQVFRKRDCCSSVIQ